VTQPNIDRSATIDLNADLGESFGAWRMGDDEAMLDVVTSANIACGFHAGDPLTMLAAVRSAGERGVRIGAHVSYRDLAGFGRRSMDIAADELYGDVLYQLSALDGMARSAGTAVAYVKPHGALYNRTVRDAEQAEAVARAIRDFDASLPVLGLPDSELVGRAAAAGLRGVPEAFADRAYLGDGTLMPRSQAGSVLHDPAEVAARAVRMAVLGEVEASDGSVVELGARSICVHGDTPGAVEMARLVRTALTGSGVGLAPFA
jgi:UPF0271 protein